MRLAVLAFLFLGCAKDPMTPLDHVHVGEETGDDLSCLDTDAGRAAVDACRARVKADWDRFHGVDGGAR